MVDNAHERQLSNNTPVTVRLPEEVLGQLGALRIIDGSSVAGELRAAVEHYVDQRLNSPDFPQELGAAQRRQLEVLSVFDPHIEQTGSH